MGSGSVFFDPDFFDLILPHVYLWVAKVFNPLYQKPEEKKLYKTHMDYRARMLMTLTTLSHCISRTWREQSSKDTIFILLIKEMPCLITA